MTDPTSTPVPSHRHRIAADLTKVVATILMSQKPKVTSVTLLSAKLRVRLVPFFGISERRVRASATSLGRPGEPSTQPFRRHLPSLPKSVIAIKDTEKAPPERSDPPVI